MVGLFEWCEVTAAQDDVEVIAEGFAGDGGVQIELRDETMAGGFISGAIENWIERQQWIAGKIHLSDEAGGEGRTKN